MLSRRSPDLENEKYMVSYILSGQSPTFSVHMCQLLSHVRLFESPWTLTHQVPLSMEFPRQDIGVDCHSLLQRIFPTQGSNLGLLYCRQIHYCLRQGDASFSLYCPALLVLEYQYTENESQFYPGRGHTSCLKFNVLILPSFFAFFYDNIVYLTECL